MADERRSARRARLAGIRATYESATGERHDTEVVDMSRAGLFLRSEAPLAPGKRLSLEIQVSGEPASWPALGRVVWTRAQSEGEARPKGMAIKLIDIDDAIAESIDRLVETREPTNRGVGARRVARERTILGVGGAFASEPPRASTTSSEPPTAPAPASEPPPRAALPSEPPTTPRVSSEPPTTPMLPSDPPDSPRLPSEPIAPPMTVADVEGAPREAPATPAQREVNDPSVDIETPPPERMPEPTIAIDLVARRSEPAPAPAAVARREALVPASSLPLPASEDAEDAPKPARKRGRAVVVLAFCVIAAVIAYVLRDQWLDTWYSIQNAVTHALGQ